MTIVCRAWNLMGGEVNFAWLPLIAEMLGCDDMDGLVAGLTVVRKYKTEEERDK